MPATVVTCDLFSALIDSRTGATAALAALDAAWPVPPAEVYDRWDATNKALQRDCTTWVPFAELSRQALTATYAELAVDRPADDDVRRLLGSVGRVAAVAGRRAGAGGPARGGPRGGPVERRRRAVRRHPGGSAARPGAGHDLAAAAGLQAEPRRCTRRRGPSCGPFVHVASSARDVRGSLEAGISAVRLVRPGHRLDPDGPAPDHVVSSLAELPDVLGRVDLR